jgi:pimeloyl-ACP methyl ester carboxylesterase
MKKKKSPVKRRTVTDTMEYFMFRGSRVMYRHAGSGRPMLFLHNGGTFHKIWERQIAHFVDRFECFAFDLPGYGASANPRARYPLATYVEFLDEFIASNTIGGMTLVGNCIGSAISLSYAMRNPRAVDRMVLFNVLTDSTVRNGDLGIIFNATDNIPVIRPALRMLLGSLPVPTALARFLVAKQYGEKTGRDQALAAELAVLYRQKGQVRTLAEILIDIPAFKKLDEFVIPRNFPDVLVIWGSSNRILRCSGGQELVRRLRPARFEILSGAGHLSMHEMSAEANRIMDDFLGQRPS